MKDSKGRTVWVPRGTNLDDLPREVYPPSEVTWDHVCRLIREGKTLTAIGSLEDMPSADILWKWMDQVPEFRTLYNSAKKARAEYRADKVMSLADEKIAEKDAPGERLRKEIFQWGAETDDRESYGKQTKVTGGGSGANVFIINTGIQDPTDVVSEVKGGKDVG